MAITLDGTNGLSLPVPLSVSNGGTGTNNITAARAALGLAVGTDVQPYDADLAAIAAISGTNGLLQKTAANTWSLDTSVYLTGNQTITFSGDATGSGATSVTLTLSNSGVTAGTFNDSATQITPYTVDAKGRITGTGSPVTITPNWSSVTNTPTTLSGYGITDGQPLDADLTAIAALTGTNGFLKKDSANTWSLDTNTYLTGNQTITFSGDATGTGATTVTLTLANSGVTAGTYTKFTVDAKGRVTSGTTLDSSDLPTYTGSLTSSQVTTALGFTPYNNTNPDAFISGVAITGDATGSGTNSVNITLANSGVTAGTYGSSTEVPVFAVDAKGRVTNVSTAAISGALTFTGDVTGTGTTGSSTALTLSNSGVTAGTYTKVTADAKGRITSGTTLDASDIPSLDSAKITSGTLDVARIPNLDASKITSGTIDAARLPSYVDDIVEGASLAAFPGTGETGKIYVALDTNKTYRWSGSAYVYITSGAVDSVAGKTGVVTLTNSDVGLGNVENKSSATIRSEITSTNVTTALGFTPYNSTNPNSYITSGQAPVQSVAGKTGAVTLTNSDVGLGSVENKSSATIRSEITSTNVTTALGFTPYNSTNPSGYISGITSSMVTTALGYTPPQPNGTGASGTWGIDITGSAANTDQIDSWPFRNTGSNSGVNADTLDSNGITYYTGGVSNFSGNATDGALYSQAHNSTWQHQIAGDYRSGQIALRGKNSGTWTGWRTVLDSGNYNSYSPTLTGGGASGTWGIAITGNSGSVGGLTVHSGRNNEANKVVRTDGNGYLQTGYINSSNGDENNNSNPDRVWGTNGSDSYLRTYRTSALSVNYASSAGTANSVAWTNVSGRPSNVSSFSNDSGYITSSSLSAYMPNGSSATNSVDVRAPIFYDSNNTGYYVDMASTSNMNVVAVQRLYAGYDAATSNSISCSNWFRSNGSSGWYSSDYGGGVHMEDSTWLRSYNSKSFYTGGSIAAAGNVTAYYSDERLKSKVGKIEGALSKVKQLEGFLYVNNEVAKEHGYTSTKQQVGVSAQQVLAVQPEAVSLAPFDIHTHETSGEISSKSGNNYLTVQYDRLIPLLIEAIKELSDQVEAIKQELK